MKQYRIRKSVLNMTVKQWSTYKEVAGDAEIMVTSVAAAANYFGYVGMLTAKANSEELEFCELLYLECDGATI